jgi:hypothetical protein
MGFAFRSNGCVKPTKDYWSESREISASPRAAKTKEKPAGLKVR